MMRKSYIMIVLFVILANVYCQKTQEIVQCNDINIDQQALNQMTTKEREKLVSRSFWIHSRLQQYLYVNCT